MRIAPLSDHPELIPRLAKWRWQEWGHLTPDRMLDEWEERLAQLSQRDRIPLTLVVFEGDQPVGLASLVHHDMDTRNDLSPWLAGLLVLPKYRKHGYGSALVVAIETRARDLGIDTLYLYTHSAQAIYEQLGWQVIKQESYQGRNVLIMNKAIGDK
jgi:GNAT superfamily N-acetyltransferase